MKKRHLSFWYNPNSENNSSISYRISYRIISKTDRYRTLTEISHMPGFKAKQGGGGGGAAHGRCIEKITLICMVRLGFRCKINRSKISLGDKFPLEYPRIHQERWKKCQLEDSVITIIA